MSEGGGDTLAGNQELVLTPLRDADSDVMFAWINDRDLVLSSAPFRAIARSDHDAWFKRIQQEPGTRIVAFRPPGEDRLIGTGQILNINRDHQSGELQIRIGDPAARGRGLGTVAVRLLVKLGFEDLDLHRIYLHVFAANIAARRVYEKVGFREEGLFQEAALIEGAFVDVVPMALLRSEWQASQQP